MNDRSQQQVLTGPRRHAGQSFGDKSIGPLRSFGAVVAALLPFALLTQGGDACAGQKRAGFAVTVTVVAVARLQILEQMPILRISSDDVRRGYVEVPDATLLQVKTNNPAGFALDFHALGGVFRAIRVKWGGGEAEIGSEGGTVVQRHPAAGMAPLRLSYRFFLAEHLPPGDYAWPLLVAARPL